MTGALGPAASPEALRRAGRHRAVLPRPPQPHGADQGAAEKVGAAPGPEAGEGPGREGATLPHRALSCPQRPAPGDLPGTGPTLHLPTLSPGLGTLTVGSGTAWLRVQAQRARSCGSSTIRGVAGLRPAVTPRGLSPEPGSVRHRVPGLTDPAPRCEAHQLRGLAPPRGARSRACLSQHVRGARLGHLRSSLETLGGSGVPPCPGWGEAKGAAHPPSPLSAPPGAWATGRIMGGSGGWPRRRAPRPSPRRWVGVCAVPRPSVSSNPFPPQAGPVHRKALPLHLCLRWVSTARRDAGHGVPTAPFPAHLPRPPPERNTGPPGVRDRDRRPGGAGGPHPERRTPVRLARGFRSV